MNKEQITYRNDFVKEIWENSQRFCKEECVDAPQYVEVDKIFEIVEKYKDKEIERLKAREEEITQKYLSATKYASEIEEKYVVDEYIIDELEMYLKRKVEETIGNKAKYYDRVLRELYKLKEGKE